MAIKNKKGVSTIIATVIMIALVISITAIVWGVINNLIGTQIASSESCFGNFGKVKLSKQYTCINSTPGEVRFALSIGDISVDSILVALAGNSGSKSFEVKNAAAFPYVKMYNGAYGGSLSLPGKNSGLTYVIDISALGVSDANSIKISPIIKGNQCEVSDSVDEIGSC
mgnify:CR=1 FL=1